MTKYCVIDEDKWNADYYYDYKIKDAFPQIKRGRVYKCISILSNEVPDSVYRVELDNGESVYIPSNFMLPIEEHRIKKIDEILKNDRTK